MNENQQPGQPYQPQPQPVPPQVAPPAPYPVQQPYAAPQENPGQMLGIIGIVVSVVLGIGLGGIILGVISRNKSKAVNMPTTLGTISLVIGIIQTVIAFIVITFFVIAIIAAANDPDFNNTSSSSSSLSNDSESSSTNDDSTLAQNAKRVAKYAEAYYANKGDYPKNVSNFSEYSESTLPSDIKMYSSLLLTNTSLTYIYCGEGSAQIVYLGDTKEDKRITPLGTASSTEVCPKSY